MGTMDLRMLSKKLRVLVLLVRHGYCSRRDVGILIGHGYYYSV